MNEDSQTFSLIIFNFLGRMLSIMIHSISLLYSQWTPSPKSNRLWSFVTSYQNDSNTSNLTNIAHCNQYLPFRISRSFTEFFLVCENILFTSKNITQRFCSAKVPRRFNGPFIFVNKFPTWRKQLSYGICVSRQTECQYCSAK